MYQHIIVIMTVHMISHTPLSQTSSIHFEKLLGDIMHVCAYDVVSIFFYYFLPANKTFKTINYTQIKALSVT